VVSQKALNHRLQAAIPPGFKLSHYPVLGQSFFRNYREVTFREAQAEVELRP
jgi:hypothetical protein